MMHLGSQPAFSEQGLKPVKSTTPYKISPPSATPPSQMNLPENLVPILLPQPDTSAKGTTPLEQDLDLNRAFELAEQYNPDLQAAKKNFDLSLGDIVIAKYIPNPQVGFNYSWGTQARYLGNPQQLFATQTFETAGKRGIRVRIAKSQYELTSKQYFSQRWNLFYQVRSAYAELVAAEESLKVIEAQALLLDRLVNIAQKRFEAGAAPEAEVLQAKLSRTQLDSQQNQAIGRINQDRIRLNVLLGNALQESPDIQDRGLFELPAKSSPLAPLPEQRLPTVDTLIHDALNARLDLAANYQSIQIAKEQLNQANKFRIPDLYISSGFLFSRSISPLTNGMNKLDFFPGVYAQVAFNLPLFNNFQGEIKKAKATIEQNRLQTLSLIQSIQGDVKASYAKLVASRENIVLYQQKLLPSAADVLNLAQESYQVGKTGLSNVIIAQQTFQQIKIGYLEAVVSYQSAWTDLEKSVGGKIEY
ncbi:MAG: TolC family protein [Cyanobacteria bacterium]|nr:TolC family protein [Cyanobacteriota bacterium]